MAKIRKLEISNFRAIKQLSWQPSPGVNCLIGPGDSGKSTILEAIDLCLGARRSYNFSDADFHALDTDSPVIVALTIGDLDDGAKSLDAYGQFLRGYNQTTGDVQDEPDSGLETVITLVLTVAADLDPQWTLYSDRATAAGITRNLTWGDRQKMALMCPKFVRHLAVSFFAAVRSRWVTASHCYYAFVLGCRTVRCNRTRPDAHSRGFCRFCV